MRLRILALALSIALASGGVWSQPVDLKSLIAEIDALESRGDYKAAIQIA